MSSQTPSSFPPGGHPLHDDPPTDGMNATMMLGRPMGGSFPAPPPMEGPPLMDFIDDDDSVLTADSMLEVLEDSEPDLQPTVMGAEAVALEEAAPIVLRPAASIELLDFSIDEGGDERTMIEMDEDAASDLISSAAEHFPPPAAASANPSFGRTLDALVQGGEDDSFVSEVPQQLFLPKEVIGPPEEATILELEDDEADEVEPSRIVPIPDFVPPPAGAGPVAPVPIASPIDVGAQVSVQRPGAGGPMMSTQNLPRMAPPAQGFGQPPAPAFGQPPPAQGFGQPPPAQGFGQPPAQGFGQPPAPQAAVASQTYLPAAVPQAQIPQISPAVAGLANLSPEDDLLPIAPRRGGLAQRKWLMVGGGLALVMVLAAVLVVSFSKKGGSEGEDPTPAAAAAAKKEVKIAASSEGMEIYDHGTFAGETPLSYELPGGQDSFDLKVMGSKGVFSLKLPRPDEVRSIYFQEPAKRKAALGGVLLEGEAGIAVRVGAQAIGELPLIYLGAVGQEIEFSIEFSGGVKNFKAAPGEGLKSVSVSD